MTILEIKAACREAIALGEKLGSDPWFAMDMIVGDSEDRVIAESDPQNRMSDEETRSIVAFIAHARTFSPEAAKALLVTINTLENIAEEYGAAGNYARETLNQICAEWKK